MKKNKKGKKNKNINKNPFTEKNIIKNKNPGKEAVSSGKSMIAYQQNLEVLKQKYPELARLMQNTPIQDYEILPDEQQKAPNLLIRSQGCKYYRGSDPLEDVKLQLKALSLKNTRLAVFLGFGLGYVLFHYARHMAKEQKTTFMLVIERDPQVFKAAIQTTDLRALISNPNVRFMVGQPEERLYVELRNYLAENSRFKFLKAMNAVYYDTAIMLNKTYYLNAIKHLRESGAHQVLNFGNSPEDSIIGIENMLDNINEIIYNPGINLLYNKFKGKPGIVVSTGPSLNKNKHLLKGLEDKALIVAADASLKVLIDMGVKPHLVASLERVPLTAKLLSGFNPEDVKDVYFAGCPVVRKETYQAYPGPRIIVYRNFDHFKWLGVERGILEIQLSSGNMAFKLAEALGCDPIILIGQDLAYSDDGTTHASGTVLGEVQGKKKKRKKLTVKGNYGGKIMTNDTWYSFLKAYDLDVAGYNGTCINSTEGGAFIQGTQIMTFQEAIDRHIKDSLNPLEVIENSISSFSSAEADQDFYKLKSLVDMTKSDMQSIFDNCQKGLELHEKHKQVLIDAVSKPEAARAENDKVENAYREICQLRESCSKDYHHTFQLFFMHVIQSFSIKFEMELYAIPGKHEHSIAAKAEIALLHKEWYSVVGDIAKIMIDILEKTETTLTARNDLATVNSSR